MHGRVSRKIAAFSLFALLAALPVMAANDAWVVVGEPSGGQVFKVVVDPTGSGTLYAMANPGVFKSTDRGADWSLALAMGESDGVDLAVDPVHPANVYAAGHDTGLWKSADGGRTWNLLNGISKAHVVVVDPVNEGVVYTIANGCDVYKSVDGGATWNLIDTGISGLTGNVDAYGAQIAVDPANPQVLYLATQVGSFQSTTGARGGSPLSGLYTSADGGAHWVQNLPTLAFADVVVDPSNDQNVYAGNYVSNDAGATWALAPGTATDLTVIAVDPADSQVMWGVALANVLGSLWTTTDQGAHWSQVSMPQGNAVYNVAYDQGTPGALYASSQAFGVYKSTDGGTTWTDSSTGISGVFSFDVLADSTGAIYMGTLGSGIFKSADGGTSWDMKDDGISVNSGTSGISVQSLVEASTPGTLYFTDQSTLYKTTDGGDTWTGLSLPAFALGSLNVLAVDPEQAETIYVGTGSGQVLKSIDAGAHWTSSVSGLPADGIFSIAVDPTNSMVVYAGGFSTGLFESTDGGITWSSLAVIVDPGFGVSCAAVDPKTPMNVYACVDNKGIEKSTDGGQTWSEAGDTPEFAFRILEIDPNDPDVIYAGIPGSGVWESTDAGAHWTLLDNPSGVSAVSRRTEAVAMGSSTKIRPLANQSVKLSTIAVDPRHAKGLYGLGSDGQLYALADTTATGGGSGSGTSASSGSGGGGAFPLLSSLLLLGFAVRRRKH